MEEVKLNKATKKKKTTRVNFAELEFDNCAEFPFETAYEQKRRKVFAFVDAVLSKSEKEAVRLNAEMFLSRIDMSVVEFRQMMKKYQKASVHFKEGAIYLIKKG